jgi:ankyrin repeat protein
MWAVDDTPIMVACALGKEEMVRLLLDYGADVNVRRGEHGNALNAAKAKGHDRTVQLLFSHGAVSGSGYEVPEWSTNTYGQISNRDQL